MPIGILLGIEAWAAVIIWGPVVGATTLISCVLALGIGFEWSDRRRSQRERDHA
jgi:hypothetical protein